MTISQLTKTYTDQTLSCQAITLVGTIALGAKLVQRIFGYSREAALAHTALICVATDTIVTCAYVNRATVWSRDLTAGCLGWIAATALLRWVRPQTSRSVYAIGPLVIVRMAVTSALRQQQHRRALDALSSAYAALWDYYDNQDWGRDCTSYRLAGQPVPFAEQSEAALALLRRVEVDLEFVGTAQIRDWTTQIADAHDTLRELVAAHHEQAQALRRARIERVLSQDGEQNAPPANHPPRLCPTSKPPVNKKLYLPRI